MSGSPTQTPPLNKEDSDVTIVPATGNESDSASSTIARDRRQTTLEGFQLLALFATFLAGVQAQALSLVPTSQDTGASRVVTAFFIGGLFADVLGAALCLFSARWFGTLTLAEALYLQQRWQAEYDTPEETGGVRNRWVMWSIRAAQYTVVLGWIFFIVGLLVLVWSIHPLVVKVISTIVCAIALAFIPPFSIKHDRRAVIDMLHLKRASGYPMQEVEVSQMM
ncbi:hypothetical protein EW146_g1545 [Bondarzewia mesenterica]|uniref:Uncharacterized protein n=1 Tax=Bondarzewia mesenterica TaxID=1095465 RepID=A0A4V3XG25_9AGAM|nr:hypothetical protein EW146_g1545 [Bondarzewia mesenterica]